MKKKVELKKLKLNKEKISILTQENLRSVLGGNQILNVSPDASQKNAVCQGNTRL
jgi:natural product precursor